MAKKFNECYAVYVVDFDNLTYERVSVKSSVDENGKVILEGKYDDFRKELPSYAADDEQYDNIFSNRDAVRRELNKRELEAENKYLKLKVFQLEF